MAWKGSQDCSRPSFSSEGGHHVPNGYAIEETFHGKKRTSRSCDNRTGTDMLPYLLHGKFCSDISTSQPSHALCSSQGGGSAFRTRKRTLSLCLKMRDDSYHIDPSRNLYMVQMRPFAPRDRGSVSFWSDALLVKWFLRLQHARRIPPGKQTCIAVRDSLKAVPHPLLPACLGPVVCSPAWESASSQNGVHSDRTSRGPNAKATTLGPAMISSREHNICL